MKLANECLHTHFGLTHNGDGIRCHFYSEEIIDGIIEKFGLAESQKERLWEFLDVKAAFYLRGKEGGPLYSIRDQQEVIALAKDLHRSASTLIDGILRLEGSKIISVQNEQPPRYGAVEDENARRFASIFGSLISMIKGIQSPDTPQSGTRPYFPQYEFSDFELIQRLRSFSASIEPITLIEAKGKRGAKFDHYKRIWIAAIINFWVCELKQSFSSECKPGQDRVSRLIEFAFMCLRPLEKNPSIPAIGKLVKEHGNPVQKGT